MFLFVCLFSLDISQVIFLFSLVISRVCFLFSLDVSQVCFWRTFVDSCHSGNILDLKNL